MESGNNCLGYNEGCFGEAVIRNVMARKSSLFLQNLIVFDF